MRKGNPVADRIQDYLANGGLFNPDLMEHDKVRDLLMAAQTEIVCLEDQKEDLRSTMKMYGERLYSLSEAFLDER